MVESTRDNKAIIVKTAIRLFTVQGFQGAPTSLIAKESGVSTGTLFYYFPTKEELITSIYFQIKERLENEFSSGVNDEKSIERKARRLWSNIIRWGVKNPDEFLFMEQFNSSPYMVNIAKKNAMTNDDIVYEVFSEAIRKGALKDADPVVAFIMVVSSARGIVKSMIDSKGKLDVDESIDQSFRLMWKGMSGE